MNNGETVSVIIPTYNRAQCVTAAIDTVLSQTHRPLEVIVVDDGSTDDTATALRAYGDRILYLQQANRGAAAARNRGIRRARGDLIALLDSDDLWEKHRLEAQLCLLREFPDVDFVFSDMRVCRGGCVVVPSFIDRFPVRSYLLAERGRVRRLYNHLLRYNFLSTSTVLFRKRCVDRVGYFDESLRSVEDRDYWLRWSLTCEIGYVDEVLETTAMHGDNISCDHILRLTSLLRVLRKFEHQVGERMTPETATSLRRAYRHTHYLLGGEYLKQRQPRAARGHLLRAYPDYIFHPKANVKLLLAILAAPFGGEK